MKYFEEFWGEVDFRLWFLIFLQLVNQVMVRVGSSDPCVEHFDGVLAQDNGFCVEMDILESIVLDVDEGVDHFGQKQVKVLFGVVLFGKQSFLQKLFEGKLGSL